MLKLIFLWFQLRAQEAFVQGQMDTINLLCGESRQRASLAHREAEAELLRIKTEFHARQNELGWI